MNSRSHPIPPNIIGISTEILMAISTTDDTINANQSSPLRILWVEDSDKGFSAAKRTLDESDLDNEIIYVQRTDEVPQQLQSGQFDIILLNLPPTPGLEMVQHIIIQRLDVPIVFIAEAGDEQTAVEAIDLGAHDYLIKDAAGSYLTLLPTVLQKTYHQRQREIQQQATLQALESREQGWHIIENATDAIFVTDTAGYATFVNQGCQKISGYPKDELIGRHFTHLIPVEWQEKVLSFYQKQFSERESESILAFPLITKDGEERWVEQTATLIIDDDSITGFQAIVRDIAERRQAEERLQTNLSQLMILQEMDIELAHKIDTKYVLSMALDTAMRLSVADAGFIGLVENNQIQVKQVLGLFPQEIVGTCLSPDTGMMGRVLRRQQAELVSDVTQDADYVAIIPETRAQMTLPLISHNRLLGVLSLETRHPKHFTPETFKFLQFLATRIAVAIDNARLVETLRQSEDKFSRIFRTSPDSITIGSLSDGRYIDVNDSFLQIAEYSRDEVIGHTPDELRLWVNPEDRTRFIQILAEQAMVRNFEATVRKKSGEVGILLLSGEVLVIDNKPHLLTAAKDITERKQAENALQKSQQTAHEFQEKLKVLHEVNIELSSIESLDELYRRAILLGRDRLDFDRLGLFLLDAQTNSISGTFVIDQTGQLRDEHDLHDNLPDQSWIFEMLRSETRTLCWEDIILTDNHQELGRGWRAVSSVWGVDHVIGFLSTDNLVHRKPLFPYQTELLALYGSTIGHLVVQKQVDAAERESTMRFRSVTQSSPDAIISANSKGEIRTWNNGARNLFGYSEQEALGQEVTLIMPTQFKGVFRGRTRQRLAGHFQARTIETNGLRKDGTVFPIELSLGTWVTDEQRFFSGIIRDITERKQAGDQLRKLSLAVEQSPASIVITDLDGNIEYVNPTFTAQTGYTLEEAIGQNPRILQSGHTSPEEYNRLWETITSGNVWQGEFLNRKKNGDLYWEHALISPVKTATGEITHYLAVKEDITKRKQDEEKLKQRNQELAAISAITVAVNEFPNLDTVLKTALQQIVAFTGVDGAECHLPDESGELALTMTWNMDEAFALASRDYRFPIGEGIPGYAFASKAPVYVPDIMTDERYWRHDLARIAGYQSLLCIPIIGREFLLGTILLHSRENHEFLPSTLALLLTAGRQLATGIERMQLFDALRENEEKLRSTLESVDDLVFVLNKDGVYIDYHQPIITSAGTRLFIPPDAFTGKHYQDVMSPDVAVLVKNAIDTIVNTQTAQQIEYPLINEDGETWFSAKLSMRRDRQGTFDGVTCVVRNITARRQAEEGLLRAKQAADNANKAKSVFLANMNHELRTPLNAILGFAQIMAGESTLTPEQHKNVETILRSGEHLLNLINDVLDISKVEAGKVTLNEANFDLRRLLNDLFDMLKMKAKNKGLSFEFAGISQIPRQVCGDSGKLRQVILNLLSNAIKFTEKGSVTLRVHYKPDSISSFKPDTRATGRLFVEVQDTGSGIASDEIDTVFEPFVQSQSGRQSQEGTGLGLAISKQFVQLMGGNISVESALGAGSRLMFYVRIMESEQAGQQIRSTPSRKKQAVRIAPGQPTYRILIAEDQPGNQEMLSVMMEGLGFEVKTANNGQEAIEINTSWQPHLIWMDIEMPVVDGLIATKRIREMGGDVIIIAVSANTFTHEREMVLGAGCDGFVAKPFGRQELVKMLETHLRVVFSDNDDTADKSAVASPTQSVKAIMLSSLPPELIEKLRTAAVNLDTREVQHLAEDVSHYDSTLSQALLDWVKKFRFDKILTFIEEWEQSN
jgi:PAS domain S-box-containing protein